MGAGVRTEGEQVLVLIFPVCVIPLSKRINHKHDDVTSWKTLTLSPGEDPPPASDHLLVPSDSFFALLPQRL